MCAIGALSSRHPSCVPEPWKKADPDPSDPKEAARRLLVDVDIDQMSFPWSGSHIASIDEKYATFEL